MNKKIILLSVLLGLGLAGCNSNTDSSYSLDFDPSVSFEDNEEGKVAPSKPTSVTLPSEGEEAVAPLEITSSLSRYANEDIHNNVPAEWTNYKIHSPYVFKYNGIYYLYVSTPSTSNGLRAYKSSDLVHWSFADKSGLGMGFVIKDKRSGHAQSPKIFADNGNFYLYFNNGNGYQVYKGTSPEGPFEFESSLGDNSSYGGYIYKAGVDEYYFFGGGEDGIYVYSVNSEFKVNAQSKTLIEASKKVPFFEGERYADNPYVFTVGNITYLTYSKVSDDFASYRSYCIAAIDADFTSLDTFANSFKNQRNGAVLLNADEENGFIGLGDLSVVDGLDGASLYGVYTSLDIEGVRSLNIDPIYLSGANLSIAPRPTNSIFSEDVDYHLTGEVNDNKLISDELSGSTYTLIYDFNNVDCLYFGYKNNINNYYISFGEKTEFGYQENGLKKPISSMKAINGQNEVKVKVANNVINVLVNDEPLARNIESKFEVDGKFGYLLNKDSLMNNATLTRDTSSTYSNNIVKPAESTIYGSQFLTGENINNFSNKSGVFRQDDSSLDYYNSNILRLGACHDYARYLIDVPSNGRYGVEVIFNYEFAYYKQVFGIRVGLNDEYMFETNNVGGSSYVKELTAEFDLKAGVNEVLFENLSNANFDLVGFKLVPVSNTAPKFEHKLDSYPDKGVNFLSDFLLNEDFDGNMALQTYISVNNFAYVGDKTITDFTMNLEFAISSLPNPKSAIVIAFRCGNYCDSTYDSIDSLTGYLLSIESNRILLYRCNYGEGITLDSIDITLSSKKYFSFEIKAVGNNITISKDDSKIFEVTDQQAFSAGHLAFGTRDAAAYFQNLSVTGGEN